MENLNNILTEEEIVKLIEKRRAVYSGLKTQYEKATGNNPKDLTRQIYNERYIDWLCDLQYLSDEYFYFLKELGILENNQTVEIEKTLLDSVTYNKIPSKIITQNPKSFLSVESNMNEIVPGKIIISNKDIFIGDYDTIRVVDDTDINYLIQNPYCEIDLIRWPKIVNSELGNITVGMYGTRKDKDYKRRINALKELKREIKSSYIYEEKTENNCYYHVLTTNIKKR